jgi:hypothetical protein
MRQRVTEGLKIAHLPCEFQVTGTQNHLPVLALGFYNLGMPVWSLMREILRYAA